MAEEELKKRTARLNENIVEQGIRIRRYTMDPRIKKIPDPKRKPRDMTSEDWDKLIAKYDALRQELETVWKEWADLDEKYRDMKSAPTAAAVTPLETKCVLVERKIDLVQRDLVSASSFEAGLLTVTWLSVLLLGLVAVYLYTHGVRSSDLTAFETWSEWGPMKYGEVAFWSAFGVLCFLLYRASHYLARRDFDKWYQPWYFTTFIRAPFLTVILMLVVLEFVEWYGEDTWIQPFLLEEGNKFYFIVLMSFCLGLATDATAGIMRDLAEGVAKFASRVAGNAAGRLGTAIAKDG